MSAQPIVMYTKIGCKYCDYAKEFMDSQGIKYKTIVLKSDQLGYQKKIKELKDLSGGHSTFPWIFVGKRKKKFIGGYTQFVEQYNNLGLAEFGLEPDF